MLGAPVGHPDFIRAQLEMTQAGRQVLLNRIPSLPDLQSAWSLLLHCASVRANYFLRVVPPELGEEFARVHDSSLWACLCTMMGISEVDCEATAREAASLPLGVGGLGLRSASRTHPSAYWARADSLHMVQKRHPGVAGHLLTHLDGVPLGRSLTSATTLPGLLMVSMGLKFLLGEVWLQEHAHLFVTLKTMSRVVPDRGGNMRLLRESSKISERLISSRD